MLFGYQKGVTRKQGADVEEGKGAVLVKDDVGGNLSGDDLTEDAHGAQRLSGGYRA